LSTRKPGAGAARYNCAPHKTALFAVARPNYPSHPTLDPPTMAALDRPARKPRPVYLNLFAIRLPLPGFVSILHRVSGALLFLAGIPFVLFTVERALASPEGWAQMRGMLAHPLAKLTLLLLAWAYLHHFVAGIRHLAMDLHVGMGLAAARQSAAVTLVLTLVLTLAVAVMLW